MLLAEKIASKVYGHPCWQVRQCEGACLSFEFGQPHLNIIEPLGHGSIPSRRSISLRGEWHLDVSGKWEISIDGKTPTYHDSSRRKVEAAIAALEGQKITDIKINPYSAETLFQFEMGEALSTKNPFHNSGEPDMPWRLFDPLGNLLTVRDDGKFSYQRADAPAEKWYTLQPNR